MQVGQRYGCGTFRGQSVPRDLLRAYADPDRLTPRWRLADLVAERRLRERLVAACVEPRFPVVDYYVAPGALVGCRSVRGS